MRVAITACLVLWAATAQAQNYKESNISAGTYPNYGCDSWDRTYDGVYYNETRLAAASPSGADAVRIAMIANASAGEDQWGCTFTSTLPDITQGNTVYLRWRVRVNTPVAWRGNYPSDGSSGVFNKSVILGNNCESAPYSPTRMITGFNSHGGESFAIPYLFSKQNIGPGISDFVVGSGDWLNIQVRIVSSSTGSASDGTIAVWINNNTVGSPDQSASGIQIKTDGWSTTAGCGSSNIKFGEANWRSLSTTGSNNASVDYADFEYDDAFDATWDIDGGGGGGGGGGSAGSGTRVRVRPEEAALPLLMVVPWLALRRRR